MNNVIARIRNQRIKAIQTTALIKIYHNTEECVVLLKIVAVI